MLETDGFWNAVESIAFWGILAILFWKFFPDFRKIIDGRDFNIKLGDNGISVQKAASKLSEYVSDLQSRVATLEGRVGGAISETAELTPINGDDRILWVDDFPSNNAVIIEGLRGRPFEVDTVLSTDDALKRFTALDHKMIITDLGRIEGGVDNPLAGLELIEAVRRLNNEVPIVVFAGQRGLKMRDRLISAGANAVTSSGYDVVKYINDYMR